MNEARKRQVLSRRRSDMLFIKALAGALLFLFIINVIFGTFIFITTENVADNTSSIKNVVCVQNSAYETALAREIKLSKTGPPALRPTHKMSADALSAYLHEINGLVDC